MTSQIVLVRHGESIWNKENRFTGWIDVGLSETGLEEAKAAGQLLKSEGYQFDQVYTSVLKRAIKTCWTVLEATDQMWLPVTKAWQLNERHYGALQGLNKKETVNKFGEEQVFEWRRSYATLPPALSKEDSTHPQNDRRYQGISHLPSCEALKQTLERVVPYWEQDIVPQIQAGKKVLIVAHGNSIRALIKHLDHVSDDEIAELNIPTGIPLVYELDQNLKPLGHRYLGDAEAAASAAAKVKAQTTPT